MRRTIRAAMLAGLSVAVAGACAFALLRAEPEQHDQAVANDRCPSPGHPDQYVGVITGGAPGGAELTHFIQATGVRPSVVPYYIPFGTPWNPAPVCRILRAGALPVIQINPRNVSLAGIAAGRQDAYLARYAKHVHEFGLPVAISFGHEMNGFWYPWGYRHTAPATVRGGLAAHRHRVPAAGRRQRDLAVDGQHPRPGSAASRARRRGGPAAPT